MKKGRLMVASSDCADMRYASGFNAPDPFIYIDTGDARVLVVSKMEFARAQSEARRGLMVMDGDQLGQGDKAGFARNPRGQRTDVRGQKANDGKMREQVTKSPVRNRRVLLAALRRFECEAWEVPGDFPLVTAEFLRGEGFQLDCAEGAFFPERARKSREEIDHVVESLRTAERGMERAIDVLSRSTVDRNGNLRWRRRVLTSETLRREIEVEIIRAGATAVDTIVACGPQAAEPHNVGTGPLRATAPIIIDVFPRIPRHGYWGDLTRTLVKGTAPEMVRRAFAAVKSARDEAKRSVRAGVAAGSVHDVAAAELERRGFKTENRGGSHCGFIHSLGHGVGLEIHESPQVSSSRDEPLETGNVITIEPGLYYPEWGGVRLEDMMTVGVDGGECLTTINDLLEIP